MASEPRILVIDPRRRGGQAAPAPDERPGEARGPVRRLVPAHRLRALELRERRLPEDRRPHAVQEPLARPAHLPDVAVLDAARELRDAGARPDAARPVLVPRLGRRHLPERQPDRRRAARPRVRVRCRPHLPHGPTSHGRAARRVGRGRDGRGDPGSARAGASEFGVIEAEADGRILRFHEKVDDPPPMPGDPTRCLASMGNYVFETQALIDIVTAAGTDQRPTDIGGDVIPALTGGGRRAALRLLHERHPGAGRARARVLARRRDARRVLRGQHGPDRPGSGLQPLQRRVAGADAPAAAPPGEDLSRPRRGTRVRRREPALPGLDHLRRPTSSGRSSGPASSSTAERRSSTRSSSRACESTLMHVSRDASSTRTSWCPPATGSAIDPEEDAARFTMSDAGIAVVEKGRVSRPASARAPEPPPARSRVA